MDLSPLTGKLFCGDTDSPFAVEVFQLLMLNNFRIRFGVQTGKVFRLAQRPSFNGSESGHYLADGDWKLYFDSEAISCPGMSPADALKEVAVRSISLNDSRLNYIEIDLRGLMMTPQPLNKEKVLTLEGRMAHEVRAMLSELQSETASVIFVEDMGKLQKVMIGVRSAKNEGRLVANSFWFTPPL